MMLGKVIRKYRKERNFTQEEMAERLGVTASAVNKWEREVTCPDIALLAPIARLLEISTDTLLSYRENLNAQGNQGTDGKDAENAERNRLWRGFWVGKKTNGTVSQL